MSWVFNLRSYNPRDSDDSESGDETVPPNKLTDSEKLWNDLDLSARPDNATYKPDPWSIAKINAASRRTQIVSGSETSFPPLTRDQETNKVTVSPKRRPTSILDAFKKVAERQPPNLHHPVFKSTQPTRNNDPQSSSPSQGPSHEGPASPIVALNSPTNANATVSLSFQPVTADSDTMTQKKAWNARNSSHTSESASVRANPTATKAHIATDLAQTHPMIAVGQSDRVMHFPSSFSSPVRQQSPTKALSFQSGVPSLSNSSPARLHRDPYIHNVQKSRLNPPLQFPHMKHTSTRMFPNRISTDYSKSKSPLATVRDLQLAGQQLHNVPEHPSGSSKAGRIYTSTSSKGCFVPIRRLDLADKLPLQKSNETGSPLHDFSCSLYHKKPKAQSPGSLNAPLQAATSHQPLEIHGMDRAQETCQPLHPHSCLPNSVSSSYRFPTGTTRKKHALHSCPHVPSESRLASRLESLSPPQKRPNPILYPDPRTSLPLPESDPDLEWTTLATRKKVKRLNAASSKGNFKMKTSGTFRLPVALVGNRSGTQEVMNSSAEAKPRIVKYLPPPEVPVHSQKQASDIKSLNSTDKSNTETCQAVATSKTPSHPVSRTSASQTQHLPSDDDDVAHINISEVENSYPATRLMMSK